MRVLVPPKKFQTGDLGALPHHFHYWETVSEGVFDMAGKQLKMLTQRFWCHVFSITKYAAFYLTAPVLQDCWETKMVST